MTPSFLGRMHGRINLPFTEGKAMGGTNLGMKIRSLVWDMLRF